MSYGLIEDSQAMSLAAPPPDSLLDMVFSRPKIQEALKGQTVEKVIVTDRTINIVAKPNPGYAHWKPCKGLDCKLCDRRNACRLYWETQQVIYPSYVG